MDREIKAILIMTLVLFGVVGSVFLNAHLLSYLYSISFVPWLGLPELGAGKLYVLSSVTGFALGLHHLAKADDESEKDSLVLANKMMVKLISVFIAFPLFYALLMTIVVNNIH